MSKFNLGYVCQTRGVATKTEEDINFLIFVGRSLERYKLGDWGDSPEDDWKMNNDALASGEDRIFASYRYNDNIKIWIITEWNREVTTILFPSEY